MRKVDAVICVSEFTKRQAMEIYGVPDKKLHVVHEGGLWEGELSAAPNGDVLRGKYSLAAPFLLSVGSSFPHKNLERLIAAYGLIAARIPHDLILTGEPFGNEGKISQAIRNLPTDIQTRIRAIGFVPREDVLGLYGCADVFVFPSLFEGFGIPALEAMECGCPVAASNAASLPEVVGSAAVLFDPINVEEMSDVLLRLSTSSSLRADMRRQGLERAKQFSWRTMASETIKVYERVRVM
jgi:glycosyltransferase involved in cell wall biosynthesis